MGEAIKNFLVTPKRLEPIIERRQIGIEAKMDGSYEPVYGTWIIGHGQQLARQRLAEKFAAPVVSSGPPSRQVRRRAERHPRLMGRA